MRGPTRLIALSITAFLLLYLLYSTSSSVKSSGLPHSWDATLLKYNPVEHFRQPQHPSSLAEPPVLEDGAQPDLLLAPTATVENVATTTPTASQSTRTTIYEYVPSVTSATSEEQPTAAVSESATDAPQALVTSAPTLSESDVTLAAQQQQQVVKSAAKKALILAKPWMVDGHWIKHELSSWETTVYNITNSTAPIDIHKVTNKEAFPPKGGAALAFLTWIIDNYDSLADVNFFISVVPVPKWSNQDAVLNMRGVAPTLHEVNVSYVSEYQYSSIRCDLEPGCSIADEIHPLLPTNDESRKWHKEVVGAWTAFTLGSGVAVPDRIANPSGAQFAATREQIRKQSKKQYESVRTWLANSNLDEDTLTSVMDSMYHIILGRPALDCPDDRVCFCDFYGQSCLEEDENTSPSNSLRGGRRKQHKKKWTPWSA